MAFTRMERWMDSTSLTATGAKTAIDMTIGSGDGHLMTETELAGCWKII
jgi:hypothetical protein